MNFDDINTEESVRRGLEDARQGNVFTVKDPWRYLKVDYWFIKAFIMQRAWRKR